MSRVKVVVDHSKNNAVVKYPAMNLDEVYSIKTHGKDYVQTAIGFLAWHPLVKEFEVHTIHLGNTGVELITKESI